MAQTIGGSKPLLFELFEEMPADDKPSSHCFHDFLSLISSCANSPLRHRQHKNGNWQPLFFPSGMSSFSQNFSPPKRLFHPTDKICFFSIFGRKRKTPTRTPEARCRLSEKRIGATTVRLHRKITPRKTPAPSPQKSAKEAAPEKFPTDRRSPNSPTNEKTPVAFSRIHRSSSSPPFVSFPLFVPEFSPSTDF